RVVSHPPRDTETARDPRRRRLLPVARQQNRGDFPQISDNSGRMAEPIRLLVVDDVRDHAQLVAEFIALTDGWSDAGVEIAASYEEALAAFDRDRFDLAFFDYWLGAKDGLSLMRDIRQRGIETPVVVLASR